jgi:hypothetical protein
MLRIASCAFVLFFATFATPALADTETASASASTSDVKKPGSFVIGGEVGAMFPQPFTELGTHFVGGLELGYRLPFAEQRFEIMLDAGYAPPANSFDLARREGTYEGKVVSQQLHFSLGPRIHILRGTSPFNITVAAGPRLFLLKSTSNGSRNGQAFAEYTEQSSQFGFFAALGGEYLLGPGAVFLDVDFGYSKLPHRITGSVNTGNIATTLGYRFFL